MKKTFINEEKGAVVVILSNRKYTGKGMSKCNIAEGDKFDRDLGVDLANKRAAISYKKSQLQAYNKHIRTLKAQIMGFEDLATNTALGIAKLEKEVDNLLKSI